MTIDNDYYTVIMISTINSLYGVFPPEVRFQHTLESIESVRRHIPNAKIVFVDNSNEPIKAEWVKMLEDRVEVFHQVRHNLFSYIANIRVATKSESEANMMFEAFNVVRRHKLFGKRIFKISGRYKISDTFNIKDYEDPKFTDKYAFVVTQMSSSEDNWMTSRRAMWLEQALISFSPANLDEFQNVLFGALGHMRRTFDCIEETLFYYIPHEKIVAIDKAHIEGLKAEGNGVVSH